MEKRTIIHDIGVHPQSGHITAWVKSVTTNGKASWDGPLRGYGVDAMMFHHHFAGDIEQVKSYILSLHTAYDGAHLELVDNLMKLKGQHIGPVQNLEPEKKDV